MRIRPWASVLAIRWAFDRGGRRADAALARHVPAGVAELLDERNADAAGASSGRDGLLDVFRPASAAGALPTIVWTHGGAWLSGDKSQVRSYLRLLASHGFTVVGINYSIAPGARYPRPVQQLNDALAHVVAHADRLHVDASRIVLAGDSAGSHVAAQVAALTTGTRYAEVMGVTPALAPDQLRGALLFCGAYDLDLVADARGFSRWFLTTALWAYSGTRRFRDDPALGSASVVRHVGPTFPQTFLSAGNADPLLAHSVRLADALTREGVPVETVFFPSDHEPALGHEYQLDLDRREGRLALERAVAFLRRVVS